MGRDILKTMGASNHCAEERSKLDYYGTDPNEVKANIDASNGLYDSVETNPNNLIIIG